MSTKGLYPAVSGAIAQDLRLSTIANNIANANTASFKRDGQLFREYLTAAEKTPDVIEVPRVPASIDSFYDMQGGDKSHVDAIGTYTDFSQGSLRSTGNSLDLALEGKGFLEVQTPQGVRLTRNAVMNVDPNGRLVTKEGYPILAAGTPGQSPDDRQIRVTSSSGIVVTGEGELFQAGQRVAKLSSVTVDKPDALLKIGQSFYALKPNLNPVLTPTTELRFHQGFTEASNVNIIREMTDMISTTRTFESLQKAIQAYDQMNEKLVNVVPKF